MIQTSNQQVDAAIVAVRWLARQQALGLLPVEHQRVPLNARTVLKLSIEGQQFKVEAEGQTLWLCSNRSMSSLGNSAIVARPDDPRGFAVTDWSGASGIDIFLSDAGRRTLAVEFGLPILGELELPETMLGRYEFFYVSHAFRALQVWSQTHICLANRLHEDIKRRPIASNIA